MLPRIRLGKLGVTLFKRSLVIPATIPLKGLINLGETSRFIQISGKDASGFINGLTTVKLIPKHLKKNQTTISEADLNNINIINSVDLAEEQITSSNWGILHEQEEYNPRDPNELPMRLGIRRDGRFGHILRANGRVFTDVFIYPTPFMLNEDHNNPAYIVEVLNKDQFKPLQMTLKMHKLRSQVDIEELHLNTWFYYNNSTEGNELYDILVDSYFANGNSKNSATANELVKSFMFSNSFFDTTKLDVDTIKGFAIDQRCDYFGLRIVTEDSNPPPLVQQMESDVLPYENYLAHRIDKGVMEVSDFQNTATLPFECNLDWMGGINYDKGCYMGQELTIRTWSGNGTVRRVLPITFDSPIKILDSFQKMELKPYKDAKSEEEKKSENPVYNPFGSSSSSSSSSSSIPVRSRRKSDKVGEVLLSNGLRGLARVEKKYFDWDNKTSKKVQIVCNEETVTGTIDTSIWN